MEQRVHGWVSWVLAFGWEKGAFEGKAKERRNMHSERLGTAGLLASGRIYLEYEHDVPQTGAILMALLAI